MSSAPVLLIGGYGVTGKAVARLLRSRHPELSLTIAGRDLNAASAFAKEIGADASSVDLAEGDTGLDKINASAVVVLAKDAGLYGLSWANNVGVPYIALSSAAFEHGIDVAHALSKPQNAPIIFAGHWFAGAVVLATLALSADFDKVDSVVAGVTIDRNGGGGGPASVADFARISRSSSATLARVDGAYVWETDAENRHVYRGASGELIEGSGAVSLDVASIGASLNAANVRVLESWGTSYYYTCTGIAADEVSIEVTGKRYGADDIVRSVLTLPRTQSTLTAISIALMLERALGLDGGGLAKPGVYTPEIFMNPDSFMTLIRNAGVLIETTVAKP